MRSLPLILILTILLWSGCKLDEPGTNTEHSDAPRYVFNWTGAYQGVLPCKDCPGIERTIYLKENGVYHKVDNYIEVETVEERGKYEWSEDDSIITFNNETKNTFRVEEEALHMLDSHGNEIGDTTDTQYVLNKVDTSLIIQYRTVGYKYESKDGDQYDLVFGMQNDEPVARISYEDKTYIYNQTEAWKGGGTYAYNGNSIMIREDEARATIDGKDIELTLVSPLRYNYTAGGKDLQVIYTNETDTNYIVIKYDGQRYALPQTNAWAKGAEYSTDEVKWIADENKAITFEVNGKEIKVNK